MALSIISLNLYWMSDKFHRISGSTNTYIDNIFDYHSKTSVGNASIARYFDFNCTFKIDRIKLNRSKFICNYLIIEFVGWPISLMITGATNHIEPRVSRNNIWPEIFPADKGLQSIEYNSNMKGTVFHDAFYNSVFIKVYLILPGKISRYFNSPYKFGSAITPDRAENWDVWLDQYLGIINFCCLNLTKLRKVIHV